jgi:hypothetical protein
MDENADHVSNVTVPLETLSWPKNPSVSLDSSDERGASVVGCF